MSTGDKREIQINHRHDQVLITQIIHPGVVGASVNDSLGASEKCLMTREDPRIGTQIS